VTTLDLTARALETFPDEVSLMPNLLELKLERNRLTRINGSLFNSLHSLQLLDLSSNALVILPQEIKLLGHLRRLNLRANRLLTLPVEIGFLVNLKELDLGKNEIYEVPESIQNCKHLVYLDVRSNRLKTLPLGMGLLTNLKYFYTLDNPFETPFKELVQLLQTDRTKKRMSLPKGSLELPSKLQRKSRRISASKNSLDENDESDQAGSAEDVRDGKSPDAVTGSREVEMPQGDEDPRLSAGLDSPIMSPSLSTVGRFSFFRNTPSPASGAVFAGAPSLGLEAKASPPTLAEEGDALSNPAALRGILNYMRDLRDLDPETKEFVPPSRDWSVEPELTSPTGDSAEMMATKDRLAAEEKKKSRPDCAISLTQRITLDV
jgi:hypothetical protein